MRMSQDAYFLTLAKVAAMRATCPRLHVGCVLVKNGRTVGTGFNGSLPGEPHCEDEGCLLHQDHCLRTIHAERNALRHCTVPDPDTIYCTHQPCLECLKEILAAGVRRIVYIDPYRYSAARSLFLLKLQQQPLLEQIVPPEVTL